ncbi:hypothetical protein XM47_06785 [Catenovulum maritimum]|uniref:Uncharacterized protein n=1 Tax=Catenovulum maritimum TaxID=1513271 RepID=A0A0J8GYU1_9ALTE|nr:hypothetical protein XM47_06785 [Catenovulum maritimum]
MLQLLNSDNLSDKQTALQLLGINNDEQLELLEKEFHSRFEDKIELLEKIEASISQIEIGLYGTCAKCDENIEQSILNQHPYAQYCQSCQSEDTH